MAQDPSRIDRATVEYVARLSRVDLSEEELGLFTRQLSDILDYINQLDELDTSGVAPLAQAVEVANVLRDDEPHEPLAGARALANAPGRAGQFYKVPAVLE